MPHTDPQDTDPTTGPGEGLQLVGITKRFGDLVANDSVDLTIRPGEIHCLLGENGAGKSTLMNVLYGLLQPDEGEILVDGTAHSFSNPRQAMAAGIGMVHQHFMLVDVFTVAENLALGREQGGFGTLDMRAARSQVRDLADEYRFDVDPDAVVEDLPVGVQQRVEILKALANDAKYLVFDEPTAVLTPQEIDELMAVMQRLKSEGRAIVFITHKLREVRAVADRITVIRRGKVVGEAAPDASEAELAELMVGRAVQLTVDKEPPRETEVRLQVQDLQVLSPSGQVMVDDISFDVRGGEILCIAGVQGNGQTELAEALIGTVPVTGGSVRLDGRDITRATPKQTIDAGMGFVPEDRKHDGFVSSFSVAENLVLNSFDEKPFARGLSLQLKKIRSNADERVAEFDIRTQSIDTPVGSLSGGNQQKVVLARELSRPLSLLIASQPTRGVDVGAIEFLHQRIVEERDNGTAVIIVSTELDEVAALADRIAVMYRGRIVGIVPPSTSRETLGLMMAGAPPEQAVAQSQGEKELR
ncbi:simple sugar transport system ATP-binding protein [Propionibacteriaceae bacterium ES.041]|uniref:ABC transporter ATP-binding protein n=1 Tax=Enemella evansiae TaxID=2016499 RepID=UPI000B970179|nr:ABC transporter ATP-binding protein [Enemella evansiae]OYN95020.1 heme ABC transporter ATP-binding protein [Enemella evansiae]PFG66217.1 simple sugar transport system ATP-binding protein [Propionibacteriaceae bacterium ES.041]